MTNEQATHPLPAEAALAEAKNRKVFAVVGGLLAFLLVLAGVLAMLTVGQKHGAQADTKRSVVVTHVVDVDAG